MLSFATENIDESSCSKAAAEALVNTYCIVKGLTSEQGKVMNGLECFVIKLDDESHVPVPPSETNGAEASPLLFPSPPPSQQKSKGGSVCWRVAVVFTRDLLYDPSGAQYKSLKPSNLEVKFGVAVRPTAAVDCCGGAAATQQHRGLFATRDFAAGEIILSEKAFLTVPRSLPAEEVLRAVRQLSLPAREALSSLVSSTGDPAADHAHEQRSVGLMKTIKKLSSFTAADGAEWYKRVSINCLGDDEGQTFLFPLICRINHRCLTDPRCNVWWSGDEGVEFLTAARSIKCGEELCADYAGLVRPARATAKLSDFYGIPKCNSSSGDGASPSSPPCLICSEAFASRFAKWCARLDVLRGVCSFESWDALRDAEEQPLLEEVEDEYAELSSELRALREEMVGLTEAEVAGDRLVTAKISGTDEKPLGADTSNSEATCVPSAEPAPESPKQSGDLSPFFTVRLRYFLDRMLCGEQQEALQELLRIALMSGADAEALRAIGDQYEDATADEISAFRSVVGGNEEHPMFQQAEAALLAGEASVNEAIEQFSN